MMTSKKIGALGSLVLVVALAGCASPITAGDGEVPKSPLRVYAVAVPGDRAVDCVASIYSGSAINPDCDWANLRSVDSVPEDKSNTLKSYIVEMEDGREVICVASIYSGSKIDPDCNWTATSNQ